MRQSVLKLNYCMQRCFVLVLLVILGACGALAPQTSQPNIPDQLYFEQQYYASEANAAKQSLPRYLGWVEKFYQGNPLQPQGWNDVVVDCVASVPPAQQQQVEIAATEAGKKIAAEWAKDNSVRKISTRQVSVWGLALREALDRDDLIAYFETVDADIDALLNDELDPKAVTLERYYEPEFNEFF